MCNKHQPINHRRSISDQHRPRLNEKRNQRLDGRLCIGIRPSIGSNENNNKIQTIYSSKLQMTHVNCLITASTQMKEPKTTCTRSAYKSVRITNLVDDNADKEEV
jgi:hypothetical protein